jgi:hypothetical protein
MPGLIVCCDGIVILVSNDKKLMSDMTGSPIGERVGFTVAPISAAGNTSIRIEEARSTILYRKGAR